jgi:circadian clock protein KaiC
VIERISVGDSQFDALLGGGIPEHSIVLVAGVPGTGKTMLAHQFAFANGTVERPALFITTSNEPLDKVIRFGQELSFFDRSAVGNRVVFESLASVLATGDLGAVMDRLVSLLTEVRPRILVIDSLRALEVYAASALEHRRFVTELAHRLAAMPITSLWLGEYDADVLHNAEAAVADAIVLLRSEQTAQRTLRYVRILKLRGGAYLSGDHTYRLGPTGLTAFPRLADPPDRTQPGDGRERISIGGVGLDPLMNGGVWPGTATLVIGPSGAGKTMLALDFLKRGARDGRIGVFATLQESPTQVARLLYDGDEGGWAERMVFHPRSPVDVYVDEWVHELFEAVEAARAELLVVDSLSDLRAAAPDAKRFDEYVYSLAQRCSRRGITLLMTLESSPAFSFPTLAGPNLSNLADNIILLGYQLHRGLIRRAIHVLKTRASGHDPAVRELTIDATGLTVGRILRMSIGPQGQEDGSDDGVTEEAGEPADALAARRDLRRGT